VEVVILGRTQPEWIGEVDRIAAGIPRQVEAAGDADGVFLGETPIGAMCRASVGSTAPTLPSIGEWICGPQRH